MRASRLLDKLIKLHSRSPECCQLLAKLAHDVGRYREVTAELESWLALKEPPESTLEGSRQQETRELHQLIEPSQPLRGLILERPRFSQQDPQLVDVLAQFADLAPDPDTILQSRDTVFMRVLGILAKRGSLKADELVQTDFCRLILLYQSQPELMQHFFRLAEKGDWHSQMRELEAELQRIADGHTPRDVGLGEPAQEILAEVVKLRDEPAGAELLDHFLQDPPLSAVVAASVLAFGRFLTELPPSSSLASRLSSGPRPPTSYSGSRPAELLQARRLASEVIEQLPEDVRQPIVKSFDLRIETAGHFLELRKFVKLDALKHRWPRLASLLRHHRSDLIALESQILDPQPLTTEEERWKNFRRDHRLRRFLKLRPLLSDIYPDEVNKYLTASLATEVEAPAVPGTLKKSEVTLTAQAAESAEQSLEDLWIRISKEKPDGSEAPDQLPTSFKVEIETDDVQGEAKIEVPWKDIEEMVIQLRRLPQQATSARPAAERPDEELNLQASNLSYHFQVGSARLKLSEMGEYLYRCVFKGDLENIFLELLASRRRFRIFWELDSELWVIPWELLYIPTLRMFPALTRMYSIIRYRKSVSRALPFRSLAPPLRLLVVFANPEGTSPLNLEREERILSRSLAAAQQEGRLELEIVRRATAEQLQRQLRRFRPHILHFSGHGAAGDEGALLFEKESKPEGQPMPAASLASFLADSPVSLVVLNACDSAVGSIEDAVSGVAGALVHHGVPAVIATLRGIADEAALIFVRELYRSLVDGYSLEAALVEGRKALSIEMWDWSQYSLFSSTTDLDFFKLLPDSMRRGSETT